MYEEKPILTRQKVKEQLDDSQRAGAFDDEKGRAAMEEKYMATRRERAVERHPYAIFYSDGYWTTHIKDKETGKRKKVKRRNREALEDFLADLYSGETKKKSKGPTIREIFRKWQESRTTVKEATIMRDDYFFEKYFTKDGTDKKKMDSMTKRAWYTFLRSFFTEGGNLTAKEWAGLRGITQGIIDRAYLENLVDYSGAEVIQAAKPRRTEFKKTKKTDLEEVYTKEEYRKLRSYCAANLDTYTAAIWLICMTGMRIGEAVTLKPDDIDLTTMTVRIGRTETRAFRDGVHTYSVSDHAKTAAGERFAALPLSARFTLGWIKKNAEDNGWEWVFCSKYNNNQRITGDSLRKQLIKICGKVGVRYKGMHSIRKTVASILYDAAGFTEADTIEQLGHTNIETTKRFYYKSRQTAAGRAKLMEEIPEIGKGEGDHGDGNTNDPLGAIL